MTKKPIASPYVSYALAAAVAGIAALLQWLIFPWVGGKTPFLFFLLGVVFAVAASGLLIVAFGNRLKFTSSRAALAEQRLDLAQGNTGVGIFELDFGNSTAFVSRSLCQMLGREEVAPGEIDLTFWLSGLRAGDVEESRRVMQERIARGEFRYEREQKITRLDGEIRWLLNRVELEASAAGMLRVARGVTVDITERKQMDELLQRARNDLKQQLEDVGRLHAFSQLLVVTGDDLPAALQALLDVTIELYRARHGIVSLRNAENGSCQTIAQAGFTDEAIERHAGESILERHSALAAEESLRGLQSVPLLSAQGEVMGVLSVMRDEPLEHCEREKRLAEVCAASAAVVVERERARASAIKNESRFSVALESSVVPFTILTPIRRSDGPIIDFMWTYLNPAAARALGREVADLIGRGIGTVLPAAWDAPGLFARYVSVLESGDQCEFETQTGATNQGMRWYNVIAAPLQGSVAVWFTNITARKKYEETLRTADRRKDEFLATLAHELRNPLAPIRQGVRIAASTKATETQRRWSHAIIERQVQHMSLLLDDLLDVSRIGRGTLLLRKSNELLSVVLDTAVEAARPHLEAKRHRLERSLPPSPVILEIDPVRIAQVLGNLLTNAAKYTDPEGRIRISAQREGPDFVIRVKDNGIGLTEEQQTQVFDMFSQVSAALEQSQGGLGIGLALARGLIELHGGTIRASSPGLGHGTEVTVRLPSSCIVSDRGDAPQSSAAPPVPAEGDSKRCILIADDDADAADSLAELLRLEGHEVHLAYDGAQALAIFARVDPDAALLDIGMPQVSGLEVVRAIRQQPGGQRATLIAVTGWAQERDRRLALEAGFDHHLTKPMQPEVICDLIQRSRSSPIQANSDAIVLTARRASAASGTVESSPNP